MPGKPTQAVYEEMWRELIAEHGAQPEYFYARKGQALIWAANLMHGGMRQLDPRRTRWSQVTHYFFDDCAYYTPMMSDVFYGSIAFRTLCDISTGAIVPNRYAGHAVPQPFIDATDPERHDRHLLFDDALYLAANPDVAAAGVNASEHYLRHGFGERRRLRP